MAKIAGIVCAVTVLILLSGCGEQLISEAQKAADQITAEATKSATRKLEEFKKNTLEQLKLMRGDGSNEEADEKSETKPDKAANTNTKLDW